MATTSFRTTTLRRPLLLGIWCTLLVAGCDTPKPEQSSKPDQSSATHEAIAEPKTAAPQVANSNPESAAPKPLDLSRNNNLESLGGVTDMGGDDPDKLLPDLFKDQPGKTGARASGRVLMSETEEASLQAIEGVEFKLEVPVN